MNINVAGLFDKWKQFVGRMNSMGIPIPTFRDPKIGSGSVSFTLLVISSLLVIVGLIGKWSGKLGGIDISNALEFFYACSVLYFGRNFGSKGGSTITGIPSEKAPESDPK